MNILIKGILFLFSIFVTEGEEVVIDDSCKMESYVFASCNSSHCGVAWSITKNEVNGVKIGDTE